MRPPTTDEADGIFAKQPLCWLLRASVRKNGILCMIDQVSLPKQVRCEYNEREPYCSYASSNAPISPRRGSIRALCIHLNEATSMFQLSRDPRTFFALDQAIDNLTFAQNVCRGSVNFMVFALMRFTYENAPPLPQVASSLQSRRSKLRHSHEGGATMFHHVEHHALESAMSRALGQFRQLMLNGIQQDHSWASAGQRSLDIYEYIRHK